MSSKLGGYVMRLLTRRAAPEAAPPPSRLTDTDVRQREDIEARLRYLEAQADVVSRNVIDAAENLRRIEEDGNDEGSDHPTQKD